MADPSIQRRTSALRRIIPGPRRHRETLDNMHHNLYNPRMGQEFALKNRVRELRSRLNMRQADLAREVDVTRQTILAIEKSRLNPSVLVSLKIARVLREPVGYIFYLDRVDEDRAETSGVGAEASSRRSVAMAGSFD